MGKQKSSLEADFKFNEQLFKFEQNVLNGSKSKQDGDEDSEEKAKTIVAKLLTFWKYQMSYFEITIKKLNEILRDSEKLWKNEKDDTEESISEIIVTFVSQMLTMWFKSNKETEVESGLVSDHNIKHLRYIISKHFWNESIESLITISNLNQPSDKNSHKSLITPYILCSFCKYFKSKINSIVTLSSTPLLSLISSPNHTSTFSKNLLQLIENTLQSPYTLTHSLTSKFHSDFLIHYFSDIQPSYTSRYVLSVPFSFPSSQ